jgi:hypothetical protein
MENYFAEGGEFAPPLGEDGGAALTGAADGGDEKTDETQLATCAMVGAAKVTSPKVLKSFGVVAKAP